ncbi:MAG: CAP domain-containing protein [Cyanobacteria bacterium P01_F01_bin.150]
MAQPTAQEQMMLELVNRARANPNGEASNLGIDLNQGLSPNQISSAAKQPLAFNFKLIDASRDHSDWMLDNDTFSHTGVNKSNPGDRMRSAGYAFTGGWTWGENISWRGTTGTPDVTDSVMRQHDSLFKSPGHRTNILGDNFREIGIGVEIGEFNGYNAVMTTQKFAKSGSSYFLTGVAFDDSVIDDDFYTVGEGLGGINVTATRTSDNQIFNTTTFGSGGYQLALGSGTYDVTFSGGGLDEAVGNTITIDKQNIKLDLATDQLPAEPTSAPQPPSNPAPQPPSNPAPQPPSNPAPQPPSNPAPQSTPEPVSTPEADKTIGEYGRLNLNHQWKTVTLNETYKNPVVIVSDPTINGGDPAVARLRNVGSNNFQIRLQEPNYKDGWHITESVSYMVVEAGNWELADGTRLSAGIHNGEILSSQGFNTINLKGFKSTPTVLSQIQTYNGTDWVTTRTTQQSSNSFKLAMQEEEKLNSSGHMREGIGWFAIDQGTADDGDTLLEGNTTGRQYTHARSNVQFNTGFESTPSVIAKLGSFYGSDTANLRLDGMTRNGFGVRVYEEQSLDSEMLHTSESVSFLALEGQSGSLTGISA